MAPQLHRAASDDVREPLKGVGEIDARIGRHLLFRLSD
jgi:hypothetical protein